MADLEQIPMCCGIHELGYIRSDPSPEDTLMSFHYSHLHAHVIFSVTSADTKNHKKGHDLANFIKANKLGDVVTTPAKPNPDHDGTIKAWLWTPNKKNLKAFQQKLAKNRRYRSWQYEDENFKEDERYRRNPYGW